MKTNPKQGAAFLLAGALALAGCQGSKGAAGTACTVHDNGNGSSTISCTDGTSATVTNGTNGANGQSCAVTTNSDGTRTITCPDGSVVTVSTAVVDYALMSDAEKADSNPSAVVTNVTIPAAPDGQPVVNLKVSDRKGNGIKNLSPLTAAAGISWQFALLKLVPGSASATGVNGSGNDTWVSYIADNATSTASTESPPGTAGAAGGTLTDNGDGSYTYRFAKVVTDSTKAGTTYDANATHRLVVLVTKSGNPFAPMNVYKDFIPATPGSDLAGQNDKVDPAACLQCHSAFRAKAGGTGAFHGGRRYDVHVCVACHNDQRRFTPVPGPGTTPNANDASIAADGTWSGNLVVVNGEGVINLPVFIHKIHMGEDLTLKGGNYQGLNKLYETHYPQDVRNCTKCHKTVAQADNWKNKPSRRACGACHDGTSFVSPAPNARTTHQFGAFDNDSACLSCHGPTGVAAVAARHVPVAPPDPTASYTSPAPTGYNNNTNAAYVAAAGVVPAGATRITYALPATGAVTVDGNGHPQITFKLVKDGTTDVVFNDPLSKQEMIDNFVGSPSVYFAFAVPQDGIVAPADFNASASGYLKNIWNGSAKTGSGAGSISSGPDANGYYTVTLTGVTIPASAVMFTGGVGYTYSLASTPPLTQTNVPGYTYDTTTKMGGLIVPAPDVWQTAVGFSGRRKVVDNSKCNACHEVLGANPTFHAGQRNDAPTCSFCHNPNRTSSGWAANVKDFIHGIHGAGKRTVPFTWHATSATEGFYQVTYPGILNNCEQCHLPGTYDFSATGSANAVPNMLVSTAGQGRYNSNATTNPNGYFSISPYVDSTNQIDYGYGFATSDVKATLPDGISGTQGTNTCTPATPCTCTTANPCSVTLSDLYTVNNVPVTFKQGSTTCSAATPCTCTNATPCTGIVAACTLAAPCQAQDTTLIKSPIVSACSACHDSAIALDHMQWAGGTFYATRKQALGATEQCLVCHGPGTIAAIADVHK